MDRAEVVVVGAGLAGGSVAWHLASEVDVLLLEQGAAPGLEASCQGAGMVRCLTDDPVERSLAIRTDRFLEDPGEDWQTSPSSQVGAVLALSRDPHHLHDAAAHLRAEGVRVEVCDRPGAVAPAMEGAPASWAWYLPDARLADPGALLAGFLRGAERRGTRVRCGVRVEGLLVESGRVVGLRTDAGSIHAERVVLACGAWSAALAHGLGLQRPLLPLERTLVRTTSHPLARGDHPWCWVDDAGIYIRPHTGGWLCCPCDEQLRWPEPGPGSRGEANPGAEAWIRARLSRFFPDLGGVDFAERWTGLRTFAPDRRPVLGEDPEIEGLWWVAGLGGSGVTWSAAVGEAVATWMGGGTTSWLRPEDVSPARIHMNRWWTRPDGDRARLTPVSRYPGAGVDLVDAPAG